MKVIELDPQELQDWMRDTWQLYASDNVNGALRRLWVNHLIEYKVVYGNDILYQGSQMTHAIAAWKAV